MVDSKPVPLQEVSQAIPGKNEITLEFHQNDETPVSLVEHIPNVEDSEDPLKVWSGTGDQVLEGQGDQICGTRHCEGMGTRYCKGMGTGHCKGREL